ncbi:Protein of unknown function (DUF3645) [Geosmithia morbida]|uniref:ubiquitinyl hydrolase 1 n=1 Tax=Geosmithia morbida TaxID=1094350 RepID=A0A9P5D3X9_9HYPO|nr:Protein of unknown function (DUF3645) [Geosmithia morbida]KAF4125447.1 Protein of unknown function (DUF3645) [Geosmithia morbida]
MENRGVLLAAPEHILAFKLSGLQCLADGKIDVGNDMIRFQDHLTRTMCRDVLDESDFTLAVQTQLVYPSGQLTTVDGSPHRWKLMQMLLSVVEDNLPTLCSDFPHAVNVVQRPSGGFPMVYILGTEINEEIRRVIVDSISNGCVPFFHPAPRKTPKRRIQATASPQEASQLIRRALSDDASQEDVDEAALLFHDPNSVSEGLLLVRGLLANGILSTCLKKRWNVQYGLHPRRWPIAVPYEAKGVPSERSEFGHPDVAILFTCLAFYYTGLDKSQLREGLRHVLQHADDPAVEYERWISGCNPENPPEGCQPEGLPAELHHWNVVNIDDDGQVETLWQQLRMTRPVIDHYLNTFVFPVHARQFSVKLQVSAWDLPIFNPGQDGEEGSGGLGARTTGFSGTNDNKMMLPLTISQDDLASLRQTNAEVLTHLLQPRNRQYVCTQDGRQRWSEDRLIHALVKSQTRILIDAGAYILEKDNEAFVQAWLLAEKERPAAVFFGASDNRECLIYFDEAHTRGVDLLLPPDACGALTLALGQTKDHTVQAAMRLRQLGSTQSVVFYAPPEVDQSIRDVCLQVLGVNPGRIESNHAVLWLLEQTCQANEQLHSLYLSYGRDFCRRSDAQLRYGGRLCEVQSRKALLRVLEQPERQTLVQLYGNDPTAARETPTPRLASERLRGFADQLAAQKQAVISTRNEAPTGDSTGAFEEVEQEREVEAQVEQIRIKQTRKKYPALSFPGLDKAMVEFVRTGELAPSGRWYEPAFKFIAETNVGMQYRVRAVSSRVFVTVQFRRTTALSNNEQRQLDNFMRPVEWVLWSPTKETALVIIPEELELLLPEIRASKAVHLLVYAAPVTRAMVRFGSLKYLTLPPLRDDYQFPAWLGTELGILAGQLYMTYDESVDMGDYLRNHAFCQDMAGFLMEWLSLRRMGQDVMHTPAAYVCQGRPLRRDHAIFAEHGRKVEADSTAPVSGSNVEERNKGEGLEETADQVGELKIEE